MRPLVRTGRRPEKQAGLALLLIVGVLGLGAMLMLVRAFNQAALSDPQRVGNERVLVDADRKSVV